MYKEALVLGLVSLLVSIVLTVIMEEMTTSYADVRPLAVMILILLTIGTVVTGYSIWEDVMPRSSPSTESSQQEVF